MKKNKFNCEIEHFHLEMEETVRNHPEIVKAAHYQNAELLEKYNLVVTVLNELRKDQTTNIAPNRQKCPNFK